MKTIAQYLSLLLAIVAAMHTGCQKEPLEDTVPSALVLRNFNLTDGDTLVYNAACRQVVQVQVSGASNKATYLWQPGNRRVERLEVERTGPSEETFEYVLTISDTDTVYTRIVNVLFAAPDSFSRIPRIYETLAPRGGGAFLIDKPECAYWTRIALYDAESGDEVYRYNGNGRPLWDGNYKGRPAPVGYYYYTLELLFFDGSQSQYDGVVELLR